LEVDVHLSRAWCDTCEKVQPVFLDVVADDENDHDVADIVCEVCKSILVTLHSTSAADVNDDERSQDISRVVGMIREAIERMFDMTLPSAATMDGQAKLIVQAIHDAAADRPRPGAPPPVTMTAKDRIMIYGPKEDGTYVIEFRTAEGDVLAISTPRSEAAMLRHFQERMPYGLCVPDVAM